MLDTNDFGKGNEEMMTTGRRRKIHRRWTILMVLIVWGCILYFMLSFFRPLGEKALKISGGAAPENLRYFEGSGGLPVDLSHLNSRNAMLVDLDTGKIMGEYRSRKRIYPASMTKIMTALLVIERAENLDESFSMPENLFAGLYNSGASMAGFWPGERVSVRDLLYGMLLPSGAEACVAVAEWMDGSEEAFVEKMNEKAAELGMKDTHFKNSTGLHSGNHYTTAADMALLLQYALENPQFREIFTSSIYTTQASDVRSEGFVMQSTLYNYLGEGEFSGGAILGGKTGYTDEAGLCLASLARVDGKEYLLVTAGAEGTAYTEPYHVLDALKVYGEYLRE